MSNIALKRAQIAQLQKELEIDLLHKHFQDALPRLILRMLLTVSTERKKNIKKRRAYLEFDLCYDPGGGPFKEDILLSDLQVLGGFSTLCAVMKDELLCDDVYFKEVKRHDKLPHGFDYFTVIVVVVLDESRMEKKSGR